MAHVIFRLDVGGLQNGLINLINGMPEERFEHCVVCLTDYTDFRARIRRDDVRVFALSKKPGNDPRTQLRLWRLFRELRPDIVHTRNLPTLECVVPAALAGVRCRMHGEHGWDVFDLHGKARRYRLLRRLLAPAITSFVAVSKHLERWLLDTVHVPPARVVQIYNGVDTDRFKPPANGRVPLPVAGFADPACIIIGTVGRLQTVKSQITLGRAFLRLREMLPHARDRLRLVLIGDGPQEAALRELIAETDIGRFVWMPGARPDVAELMRGFDVFVLPSLNEGISNTVLEAMATGLPVVATDVGGNGELVQQGCNGSLVPPADPDALAQAISRYVDDSSLRRGHGIAGRNLASANFSLASMVGGYVSAYDAALQRSLH
ncbi:MAG: TIGR03088 family PEP-CTERM/XrtA system glycosyltransferase [Gammaproteobacteria bacterium]